MQPPQFTAVQSADGKWFCTGPGWQSSGWHTREQCQRFADSKRLKPAKRERKPLDLRAHHGG